MSSKWDDFQNTPEEAEEMALHAAQVYSAMHGVRVAEALRTLNAEIGRLARDVGKIASMKYFLSTLDQMLPPETEAPLLHAGVTKVRARVRQLEDDGFADWR